MKTTLTQEQLEHFKDILLRLKAELLLEMHAGMQDMSIPNSAKDLEEYIISSDSTILQEKKFYLLKSINRALEKIALGTYGVCEETCQLIPIKRLEILPYTPYTVEGSELRNQ